MTEVLSPDLCVVGAGASGLAVARAARRLGASVVLVEKGQTGGMSLAAGALALRALSAAADIAIAARNGGFGVSGDAPRVNFRKVHEHVAAVIGRGRAEVLPEVLAAQGIELVKGEAAFSGPSVVKVGDTEIRARRFVIATGAQLVQPDIPGLLSVPFFTTENIFDNTRKLTHLVIAGAGPMAVELALAYRRLGCEVTIVEAGRALPHADPELAEIALRRLGDEGVALHEDSVLVAIQARSQGIGVVVRARDEPLQLDASHILVASERVPNLSGLNIEAARIRRDKSGSGALVLNGALRTSNPRIWAVGEAAGHAALPHLAAVEATIVTRAALLGLPSRYDPAAVPRVTLTDPPIAEIGLTEPMARSRFRNGFSVLRAGYGDNDMARAAGQGMGVVKLMVAATGQILGAGIVGPSAPELAALLGLAIGQKLPAARLAELAAPYPSHAGLVRALGEMAAAGMPRTALEQRLFRLNRLLR